MAFVRVIFSLLTVIYAALIAGPATVVLLDHFGQLHLPVDKMQYAPLIGATPLWLAIVGMVAGFIYLIAAYGLVARPRGSLGAFILAALLTLMAVVAVHFIPAFRPMMTHKRLMLAAIAAGGLAVLAIVFFIVSRTRVKRVTPTVLGS